MFGSKNSEFTRKYDSNWFDSMTLRFHKSCRLAYSQNPIVTKSSASATASAEHWSTSRRVHRTVVSSLKSRANGT